MDKCEHCDKILNGDYYLLNREMFLRLPYFRPVIKENSRKSYYVCITCGDLLLNIYNKKKHNHCWGDDGIVKENTGCRCYIS